MKLGSKLRFALIAAGVFAVIFGAYTLLRPTLAQMGMVSTLREAGFKQVRIEKTRTIPGGYNFLNITLDGNGFSTIERMALQAETLSIDKMVLTGEWSGLQSPDIAGWSGGAHFTGIMRKLAGQHIKNIILNSGQMDVTIPHLGLIRVEGKAIATLLPDGALRLQSTVWSVQQKMKAQLTINGEFAPNGLSSLDIEVNDGKINTADFNASRIGGWIILNHDQTTNPWSVSGQIMAGTATLLGATLNSLTLSIQGNMYDSTLALQANGTNKATTPLAVDLHLRRNGEDTMAATYRVDSLGNNKPGAVFVYDSRGPTLESLFNTGAISIADLAGKIWVKAILRRNADQKGHVSDIDIQEVHLQQLADSFGLLDVTIDGSMTGLLSLGHNVDGKWTIDQGLLRSTGTGRIDLTGKGNTLPPPLSSTREDTAKLLHGFTYDKIELLVNGVPFKALTADISMTGKSATDKAAKTTLLTLRAQ